MSLKLYVAYQKSFCFSLLIRDLLHIEKFDMTFNSGISEWRTRTSDAFEEPAGLDINMCVYRQSNSNKTYNGRDTWPFSSLVECTLCMGYAPKLPYRVLASCHSNFSYKTSSSVIKEESSSKYLLHVAFKIGVFERSSASDRWFPCVVNLEDPTHVTFLLVERLRPCKG